MPNFPEREEEFEFQKRGRAVNEEQHAKAVEARTARLLSLETGGASGGRVMAPGRPRGARYTGAAKALTGASRSRESVLKVIGWSKTQHSAKNQAFYITRTREADNPSQMLSIENEMGERIEGKEEIAAELASWDLAPAAANRSKAWHEASPEERADMKADQALSRRQSAHLIFSIPADRKADAEKLGQAVRAGLSETLGAQSYRYVFAIHTDHSSRPHAHIVVKARSEAMGERERTSRQLRLNPADLDAMRQVLTNEARARGLDVVATRRVDRARTRKEIAKGQAPLRENKTRGKLWRAQTRQGSIFEAKAPNWYARHGLEYETRRLRPTDAPGEATRSGRSKARPGLFSRMTAVLRGAKSTEAPSKSPALFENQVLRRLDERFSITHDDPQAARDSFAAMYREAPKLATWAMNHHPEAFGQPTGKQAAPLSGRGMTAALQALPASDQVKPAEPAHGPGHPDELLRRQNQARTQETTKRDAEAARHHLEAFAAQIERGDPTKKALAEEIRTLARGGTPDRAKTAQIQQAIEKARKRYPQPRGRGHGGGADIDL